MWTYLTMATGGRMTPLERTLLLGGIFSLLAALTILLGGDSDRFTAFESLFLVVAFSATAVCSELRWWMRLALGGLILGALQIASAYLGAKPHAFDTGYVLSAVLSNAAGCWLSGLTDLPGFYRQWAGAAQKVIWRRVRWFAYYALSFVVIATALFCSEYFIDLVLHEVTPTPGITPKEDWVDYMVFAAVTVFAILIIGRRLTGMSGSVRILRPALGGAATSAMLVAAMQTQLLTFHRLGVKAADWQNAAIKEAADEWSQGAISGLTASATGVVAFGVVLIPLFILMTAMADRAKAQGRISRLAVALSALGLIFVCSLMGAAVGAVLLGWLQGTARSAVLGNMAGAAFGFLGAAGWLIWRWAQRPKLMGITESPAARPYATGTTTLPAAVASAVEAARATGPR